MGRSDLAARQLGITEATLRVHLHRACRKLGTESRLEAISLAIRAGLIRPPALERAATGPDTR
jgi:DNA-binding CsgD family transcriptional regulator